MEENVITKTRANMGKQNSQRFQRKLRYTPIQPKQETKKLKLNKHCVDDEEDETIEEFDLVDLELIDPEVTRMQDLQSPDSLTLIYLLGEQQGIERIII